MDSPPIPFHQVRALYDTETITVYQAFRPEIANAAVAAGTFVAPFSMSRMTWIKPSFLWMMYRCGWATKPGQERVLAVRITRVGFEQALSQACLAHFDPAIHQSEKSWKAELQRRAVRVQWDPERDPDGSPLPYRSLQVGLPGGDIMERYVHEWIVEITDITETLAARRAGALPLPDERPYRLPESVAGRIGASPTAEEHATPKPFAAALSTAEPAKSDQFSDRQRLASMSLAELWQLFPIQLRPHNPAYPQWFAAQAAKLRELLGARVTRISHIGSTAVPGLVAKPIVDILAELDPATGEEPDLQPATGIPPEPDPTAAGRPDPRPIADIPAQADGSPGSGDRDADTIVEALEAAGWALMNRTDEPFRLDLCRGYTPQGFADQVFHLHIVRPGDHDELYFRDWLRERPPTCREYEALKRRLAAEFEHDRDAYTEAKTDFIRSVTRQARATYPNRYPVT